MVDEMLGGLLLREGGLGGFGGGCGGGDGKMVGSEMVGKGGLGGLSGGCGGCGGRNTTGARQEKLMFFMADIKVLSPYHSSNLENSTLQLAHLHRSFELENSALQLEHLNGPACFTQNNPHVHRNHVETSNQF